MVPSREVSLQEDFGEEHIIIECRDPDGSQLGAEARRLGHGLRGSHRTEASATIPSPEPRPSGGTHKSGEPVA